MVTWKYDMIPFHIDGDGSPEFDPYRERGVRIPRPARWGELYRSQNKPLTGTTEIGLNHRRYTTSPVAKTSSAAPSRSRRITETSYMPIRPVSHASADAAR